MKMTSSVLIHRTPEEVWRFLGDPANVTLWDRGVGAVEEDPNQPRGVGYEFDTLADAKFKLPDQGRMSYRIKMADETAGRCIVELTSRTGNARFFRTAEWQFDVQAAPEGAQLTCSAVFSLRWLYLFLGPLLYINQKAILIDLNLLKSRIEAAETR